MGFDVGAATVEVLEVGLPPLPSRLEPSQTVPVALWRGERYGAVLFVQLWRNGNVDSQCAVTELADDGSWQYPASWGGGGWIDDPLVRSETGWNGNPVALLGLTGIGFVTEDERDDVETTSVDRSNPGVADNTLDVAEPQISHNAPSDFDEPWDGIDVRAVVGAASAQVAAIEVEHGGRTWTVPIESPCGAFIIGLEAPGPATLRALDEHGQPLADASGATQRVA